MKLSGVGEPFRVEDKRFCIPGVRLKGKCPGCGASYKRDFAYQYLSFPTVNQPIDVGCYCPECDHEWDVKLIVHVTLELVDG